jgi:hypothetical protein
MREIPKPRLEGTILLRDGRSIRLAESGAPNSDTSGNDEMCFFWAYYYL